MAVSNRILSTLDNKYNLAFLIILFTGIFIRLKYLFIESIWHDEAAYMWQASQLLNPSYIGTRIQEPLAIMVIRFYSIFTHPFTAGRLMGLTFAVIGIIAIYLLGSEIKNKFIGIIASLLLTFHHLFWYLSEKALLDVPLTTMFILVAYFLIKAEKSTEFNIKYLPKIIQKNFWSILLGLTLIATVVTKQAGVLAFVYVLMYFLITRKHKIIKDKIVAFSLGVPTLFILIGSLIYYVLFKDFVLYKFFYYLFAVRSLSQPFNFVRILPTVLTWFVLPIFLLGVIFSLLYRRKSDIILLLWFWVYFIFFSINIGGPLPRYLLPIVPAALLLVALAIDEIRIYLKQLLNLKIPKIVFIVLVVLLCVPFYQQGESLNVNKSDSYTGFREAGEWLAQNVPEDAVVYAGSPAAIRLFYGYEYLDEGYADGFGSLDGKIYYGFPATKQEFEQQLQTRPDNVYLEVDIWEYKNQQWMYPLSQENFDYLASLGFQPVYAVEREVMTQTGLQKIPVIYILKN
jgi:4-amino-4-deoxy-L-arabinose transferase-like glycosyltransferase